MSPANRAANIADELSHARECLRASRALVELDLDRDAMSRLYYAVFHATLALLLTEAIEPSTHRGVLSQLSLEFIKPGKVPADLGATLRRLQGYREASDYTRGFVVPPGEASRELAAAEAYLTTVVGFVERAGFVAE